MAAVPVHVAAATLLAEIPRRRTFAIISHPTGDCTALRESRGFTRVSVGEEACEVDSGFVEKAGPGDARGDREAALQDGLADDPGPRHSAHAKERNAAVA